MKILPPSTRTTVRRFNLICEWPGPIKQAFSLASGTDTRDETTRVVVIPTFTYPEGHGTFRINNLFCHGEVGVTARQTYEGIAAGIQPRSCINKDVYRLVLLQLLTQTDDQRTPWNVLGGYWVNREAPVCTPSMHALLSRSRIRVCT